MELSRKIQLPIKFLTIGILVTLFLFTSPKDVMALACPIMTLSNGVNPPPPSQNTNYTISLDQCSIPAGNQIWLSIRPQGSNSEVFSALIADGNTKTTSYSFSNFLTQDDIDRFGNVQQYEVYLVEINVFGTQIDIQQPSPSRIFMTYDQNQPVVCGAIIPNDSPRSCPVECPRVDLGNGTSRCTVTPTQIPPESCSDLTFTPIKQGNVWNFAWRVGNTQGLQYYSQNQNIQYEAVAIRLDNPIAQRNLLCGPVEADDIVRGVAEGGCNYGDIRDGERIQVVVERQCSLVGNCSYYCQSAVETLQIQPTVAPNVTIFVTRAVTPAPTPYCSDVLHEQCIHGCTPTIGGGRCNSSPPGPVEGKPVAGQVQPCTINGQKGINTAIGCIPSDPGALFRTLLTVAIGIAGGIAFMLIILGGIRILASTGNPEAMNEGREIVTSALTGLLLIIFSVFILRFIGVDVLAIPGFS